MANGVLGIVQWDTGRLPLPDNSIDMIFTDPPYVAAGLDTYRLVANEAARVLKQGAFIAVMCGGNALNKIIRWFDDAGLEFWWLYQLQMTSRGAGIVWRYGNTSVPISVRTKHVLVYSRGRSLSRTATTGLYRSGGVDKRWHYWGQSVDSHRYYIDCLSKPGDLVLDPMGGGGTTAVACEILGRRCVIGDVDSAATATMLGRLIHSDGRELSGLPLFGGNNG